MSKVTPHELDLCNSSQDILESKKQTKSEVQRSNIKIVKRCFESSNLSGIQESNNDHMINHRLISSIVLKYGNYAAREFLHADC